MKTARSGIWLLAAALGAIAASGVAEARTFRIEAGAGATEQLQAAAARAQAGDEISFTEGVFEISTAIAFKADRLTLRGRGPERTVLKFSGQTDAAQAAVTIDGDRIEVADLAIEEAAGDALRLVAPERANVTDVRVAWSGRAARGANGIVVEEGRDVRIGRVRVERARAGGVALRRADAAAINEAVFVQNRVGLIIETSTNVALREIETLRNGTGVLLANAPAPGASARGVSVTRSRFDGALGGPPELDGDLAALAPEGVGLAVMGYAQVWVEGNTFAGSALAHVMALAYPGPVADPAATIIPQELMITRNAFDPLGPYAPTGRFADLAGMEAQADVLWDGAESWVAAGRPKVGVVRIGFDRNRVRGDEKRPPVFKTLDLGGAGLPASEAAPKAERPLLLRIPEPEIRAPKG